ncbi:MAG: DUF192 domain-containing protein [Dehalococcoidia bacterium]
MTPQRHLHAAAALILGVALLACSRAVAEPRGDASAAIAAASPGGATITGDGTPAASAATTPAIGPASGMPSGGTTATPAATRPASPTPIATPRASATPAIPGQPIASTSTLTRAQLPPVEFVRNGQVIATLPIEVLPPAEFSVGFSGRPALSDERGMLFYYPKMARGSFWMNNTHFDLAIAFVADSEAVVDVVEMQRESTSIVTPKADYRYAIEAPAGWYLSKGIRVGDRARLAFPLPAYLTQQ